MNESAKPENILSKDTIATAHSNVIAALCAALPSALERDAKSQTFGNSTFDALISLVKSSHSELISTKYP